MRPRPAPRRVARRALAEAPRRRQRLAADGRDGGEFNAERACTLVVKCEGRGLLAAERRPRLRLDVYMNHNPPDEKCLAGKAQE